jgi:peptidoglycan/LPS O-acetylase OafA/YrhL
MGGAAAAETSRARRFELDWLRVLAIAAVFLFHSGRFFDPLDWHVKNPTT